MASFDPTGDFESLLRDFAGLLSANLLADSKFDVELAKQGFARHCPIADWAEIHASFLRERCEGELSSENLQAHGDGADAFRAFACLSLGALLGRYQTGQIDDLEFARADALLPGFMYLHLPEIEAGRAK